MKYKRDPITGGKIRSSLYDTRYQENRRFSNQRNVENNKSDNIEVLGSAIESIINDTKKVRISDKKGNGVFIKGATLKPNKYIKVNF